MEIDKTIPVNDDPNANGSGIMTYGDLIIIQNENINGPLQASGYTYYYNLYVVSQIWMCSHKKTTSGRPPFVATHVTSYFKFNPKWISMHAKITDRQLNSTSRTWSLNKAMRIAKSLILKKQITRSKWWNSSRSRQVTKRNCRSLRKRCLMKKIQIRNLSNAWKQNKSHTVLWYKWSISSRSLTYAQRRFVLR